MRRKKTFLISFIFLLTLGQDNYAQKQANIWYFGNKQGLDFNSGIPTFLGNSAMNTAEGCASLADTSGSLLFYTDGLTIWDASHNVMSNGNNLKGDESSTQSAIIVPYPTKPHLYYVFTVDERLRPSPVHKGFHYSIVDMRLNGGLGVVTTKNVQLLTQVTEKVTGVSHCNSGDIWVVTHGWNNNRFYAYLITSTGLKGVPVTSDVGMVHGGIPGNSVGYMKASPDGRKIACAVGFTERVQVFDFNAETGVLSNPTTFSFPNNYIPYGLEFSPNGDLLYVGSANQGLTQIDLMTNTTTLITSRSTTALQLGPDGRIYSAYGSLGAIRSPNSVGAACNYALNAGTGASSAESLPTFNQSLFEIDYFQNMSYRDTCFGDSARFTFTSNTMTDSILWNFGDPASSNNTGRSRNTAHLYSDTGVFTVELKVYNLNCPVPFEVRRDVYIHPLADVILTNDTTICDDDLLRVEAEFRNADNFSWWDGNTTDTVRFLPGPATYSITSANSCGTSAKTITVDVFERIDVDIPGTVLCDGDSVLLNAFFPDASYEWQDGSTDPTFMVRTPGIYDVRIETPCYDTLIEINILEDRGPPPVDLGNDTSICIGDSLVLDVGYPLASYLWQDGSTDSLFIIHEAGRYHVNIEVGCYVLADTINIEIQPLATLDLGSDTAICFDRSFSIVPLANDTNIRWQDGSRGNRYVALGAGKYYATIESKCNTVSDTLLIFHDYPPNINLPRDTTFCENDVVHLDLSIPRARYLWQDNSVESYFDIRLPGFYDVLVSNACGVDRASIEAFTEDCECTLFVPNAFTPNDDQLNNFFKVVYDCDLIQFQLQVFDRWGKIIYETRNPQGQWNGRYPDGQRVPLGPYAYKIGYTALRNEVPFTDQLSGTVMVLR